MAYILPANDLLPWCEHGTPLGHRCQFCPVAAPAPAKPASSGWRCPGCGRCWNPSVLACHHCPASPVPPLPDESAALREPRRWEYPVGGALAAGQLRVPPEMMDPDYQRLARVGRDWKEVLPGLQCYARNPFPDEDAFVTLCFRLTPAETEH
jgi:hypothetical protein